MMMERRARIVTGLTLFAYAACHFLGHTTGVFGVGYGVDRAGRSCSRHAEAPLGRACCSFRCSSMAALGLRALVRARTCACPAIEVGSLP